MHLAPILHHDEAHAALASRFRALAAFELAFLHALQPRRVVPEASRLTMVFASS